MSVESMADERLARREAEISLLQAMYPSDMIWHEQRQEITYKPAAGGTLTLRVSDEYPGSAAPELIQALDADKDDIRTSFRARINDLLSTRGEEVLDALLLVFEEVVREHRGSAEAITGESNSNAPGLLIYKTVVVWLHHLLNTNKRKLALNPSNDAIKVSGITKPGYPGILVYSGELLAIDAHIAELKHQRWQAFQVRFEDTTDAIWAFSHGSGVREVETISEVAQHITSEHNRQRFLEAVGIK